SRFLLSEGFFHYGSDRCNDKLINSYNRDNGILQNTRRKQHEAKACPRISDTKHVSYRDESSASRTRDPDGARRSVHRAGNTRITGRPKSDRAVSAQLGDRNSEQIRGDRSTIGALSQGLESRSTVQG